MSRLKIVGAILLLVLVTGMIFYLYRTAPPAPEAMAPEPVAPAAAAAQPPPPPARQPPGPQYRANTIVPPPTAELSYTPINIDMDGNDVPGALASLAQAASAPFQPVRNRQPKDNDPIDLNIHLQNQPFMEAYMELEAQSSLTIFYNAGTGFRGQYTQRTGLPGIWSICGPFAFVLFDMQHSIQLNSDGRAMDKSAPLTLQFNVFMEPQLNVLRYPREFHAVEAVDDHGNSLIRPEPSAMNANNSSVNFPPGLTLTYPDENPGRKIKHLKATGSYLVQLKSQRVVLKDPANVAPAEQTFSGVKATFTQAKWLAGRHYFEFHATYQKGDYTGDWPTFASGLISAKAHPAMPDFSSPTINLNGGVNGDTATAIYLFMIPASMKGNPAVLTPVTEAPAFDSLTLDVPSELAKLEIPIELNDIPLP